MFVKQIKNNTYFKRYQVRFRRRREGKTDYYQRKRLIQQRKNKYNTPKYRLIVRRTNTKIIVQVASSTINGDLIRAQAMSSELKKYGVTAGLTNYAACYATGLLCSRRLLTKIDEENKGLENWTSIADRFNLVKETTGDFIDINKESETKDIGRPFVCFLDLGLNRSTKGARVFAAMKGAVDGGIHIPHKAKIFPAKKAQLDKKGKETKAGVSLLRERIFGNHVQNYIDTLKKSKDPNAYKDKFSKWDECLKNAKVAKIEDLYKKVFAEIRKNPSKAPAKKREQKKIVRDTTDPNIVINGGKKYRRDTRLNNQQRKERVAAKINKFKEEREKAKKTAAKKK